MVMLLVKAKYLWESISKYIMMIGTRQKMWQLEKYIHNTYVYMFFIFIYSPMLTYSCMYIHTARLKGFWFCNGLYSVAVGSIVALQQEEGRSSMFGLSKCHLGVIFFFLCVSVLPCDGLAASQIWHNIRNKLDTILHPMVGAKLSPEAISILKETTDLINHRLVLATGKKTIHLH